MNLRAGMTLATKDGQLFSNAVVYDVIEFNNRKVIHVLTDFGNIRVFMSEADMLMCYDIKDAYLENLPLIEDGIITHEDLDDFYNLRGRIERQIELLTEALKGLK